MPRFVRAIRWIAGAALALSASSALAQPREVTLPRLMEAPEPHAPGAPLASDRVVVVEVLV